MGLGASLACSDGPFYQLKKINPIYRKQWEADRQIGPTFEDRRAEMQKLKKSMKSMDPAEQGKWVKNIERILAEDPSADMRRDAILALREYKGPELVQIMSKASRDESEKVRMATCETLAKQGDNASLAVLSQLASKDESPSVKIAAIEAIGSYKTEEAKQVLAQTIEDSSPAIQYQTVKSLAKVTGRDLGGDVKVWKQYLAGENVEEPTTSLAEQWMGWMNFRR